MSLIDIPCSIEAGKEQKTQESRFLDWGVRQSDYCQKHALSEWQPESKIHLFQKTCHLPSGKHFPFLNINVVILIALFHGILPVITMIDLWVHIGNHRGAILSTLYFCLPLEKWMLDDKLPSFFQVLWKRDYYCVVQHYVTSGEWIQKGLFFTSESHKKESLPKGVAFYQSRLINELNMIQLFFSTPMHFCRGDSR